MTNVLEGEDLARLSVKSLLDESEHRVSLKEPFLITDLASTWQAYHDWTPDSLVARCGDRQVEVWKAHKELGLQSVETITMPLAQYVEEISNPQDPTYDYYIGSLAITKFLPELSSDYCVSEIRALKTHLVDVLYFGAHLYSQLHYHPYGDALLSMVYGEKTVRMMAPNQTTRLYKYGSFSGLYNFSKMGEWMPDPDEFPDYQKACHFEIQVKAGETLFIPAYWWHGIQNQDVNIAITSFYKSPFLSRWMPPRGLRTDYFLGPLRWLREKM